MPKFYKGQKVVCINQRNHFLITKGHTYVVEGCSEKDVQIGDDHGSYTWYDCSMFKPAPFTKADLKDGMVVKYKNGFERYVINNTLYERKETRLLFAVSVDSLTDTLQSKMTCKWDIVKVSYMGEVLWVREEESERDKTLRILKEEAVKAQKALDAIQKQIKESENA